METVLVVESDPSRSLYAEELQDEGYDVVCAGDGPQALALAAATDPDIVILDNDLPHSTGYELMSQLLVDKPQLPVLVISATPAYLEPFTSWMADAYVLKSSDLDELKSRTSDLLSKRGEKNHVVRQ